MVFKSPIYTVLENKSKPFMAKNKIPKNLWQWLLTGMKEDPYED